MPLGIHMGLAISITYKTLDESAIPGKAGLGVGVADLAGNPG